MTSVSKTKQSSVAMMPTDGKVVSLIHFGSGSQPISGIPALLDKSGLVLNSVRSYTRVNGFTHVSISATRNDVMGIMKRMTDSRNAWDERSDSAYHLSRLNDGVTAIMNRYSLTKHECDAYDLQILIQIATRIKDRISAVWARELGPEIDVLTDSIRLGLMKLEGSNVNI